MNPNNFVKEVVKNYNTKQGIFENRINAEDYVPKKASDLDKSRFIFYITGLDYATKSQPLYERANKLFTKDKKLFDPKHIAKLSDEDIYTYIINFLKPRYPNEAVKRFGINSKLLIDKYKSNPKNIFTSSQTAKEAIEKVRDFRGYGPKIGNFFARTIINYFSITYSDIDDILIPVDRHDVKISYLMGFIDNPKMSKKNIDKVKNIFNLACKETKTSWLIFDKALWIMGSMGKPQSKEDVLSLINC